ncbi:MAG: tryptophan--tRNA ligase [Flavobacteriaceae bacterium]|nr:tryptophan--tRNA ligase [Flavobacteriaceae bacterium]MCY4216918.1 tryptophan--tRNA ligase [Flavobacteriaceae bacterium]MCY4253555.1 tryptophan--tRNA ligase [Flavobacteriaceae bacterium]
MARVLTGVQSTGIPHLGNLLGAIIPAVDMSKNDKNDSFLFIADLHSLTQIKDAGQLKKNTLYTAAAWLACGLDPQKTVFYRQSDVCQTTELSWYLQCFFPYQRLTLAHSFKDKSDALENVNAGLFNYPLLMAADILLYDADMVPVGKDQKQHMEITRDVAKRFNHLMGKTLIVPKAQILEDIQVIPGTDGQKMSKSKNNIISVFEDTKTLQKQVMSIQTDSKGVDEVKDPLNCNVFKIYSLVAQNHQIENLKTRYLSGIIGYGDAKKLLIQALLSHFETPIKRFHHYMSYPEKIEDLLYQGAQKARKAANKTLLRVRQKLGYYN